MYYELKKLNYELWIMNYELKSLSLYAFSGADWFWQREEAMRKRAEQRCRDSLIPDIKILNGENNYALAAWLKYSRSA